jgi:hypothetical protein
MYMLPYRNKQNNRSKPAPKPYQYRPQIQPHLQLPFTQTPTPHEQVRSNHIPPERRTQNIHQVNRYTLQEHRRAPTLPRLKKWRKTREKHLRRWLAACSGVMLIIVLFASQGNGTTGAWFADSLRAMLGPTATAQIEAWYLGFNDFILREEYQLNGKHVATPWTVGSTPLPKTGLQSKNTPSGPKTPQILPMALPQIQPIVTPSITGAGTWSIQQLAPSPYNALPLVAKTFIQPDPSHPYAVVTMLQFDSRFISLHMVAGTSEPGGSQGFPGPGVIPSSSQQGNALLAAFNGGFKYADGQYGMAVGGVVYVPPQPGAATIAVTKQGQIILGAWGVDPRLNSNNADLVAWRQNASLLINNGVINPLSQDGAAWGATILNSAYTWRSGLGITANGNLVYAGGNSLTAQTLAVALKAAGAVLAMQTDINPYWVRAFLYQRNNQGGLNITKLNPNMQGSGTEYLNGTARDFFYLTRVTPISSSLFNPPVQ